MDNKTVLIVDDDEDMYNLLSPMLKKMGFEVFTEVDGYDAVDTVIRIQPAIVFLDILLPRLNGFDVCVKIKQNKKSQSIPVVFVSALESSEIRQKAFNIGALAYIEKPVNFKIFKRIVEKLTKNG
jgi:DNA-binding response OmpR family regulator